MDVVFITDDADRITLSICKRCYEAVNNHLQQKKGKMHYDRKQEKKL